MDLANIIALVSQHNVDPTTTPDIDDSPEVVETLIGRNLPRPERKSKQVVSRNESAPIHNQASAPGVLLNTGEKLDAEQFIMAMRNAGKRRVEGKSGLVFDKNHERTDQIQAIASYCGYDNTANFGSQQQAAMAKAQSEMRAKRGIVLVVGPSREERKAAERSMTGFVHGMPVPQQRIVLDLQARAQAAAEARDKATTEQDRAMHQAVLTEANKALAELGF